MFPFMLSYSIQRSVIIRFLVSSCGWGVGGGDVMNLVYGSSSSSYMDCEVNFVYECYDSPIWDPFQPVLLRRRLRR